MIGWTRWLALAVPGAMLGFCWLTMLTETTAGSESMRSFGFPFSWYAPDPASSQAYDIALGPVAIDLATYLLFASLVLRWLAPPSAAARRRERVIGLVAWLGAAISVIFTLAVIGLDVRFVAWSLDGYFGPGAQHRHAIHFGPGA